MVSRGTQPMSEVITDQNKLRGKRVGLGLYMFFSIRKQKNKVWGRRALFQIKLDTPLGRLLLNIKIDTPGEAKIVTPLGPFLSREAIPH